jgi:hypothetical protein
MRQGDVHDVGEVRGLARDDEGLCELQPDDPGLDVHARSLTLLDVCPSVA